MESVRGGSGDEGSERRREVRQGYLGLLGEVWRMHG